jgi:hypothetical protein
MDEKRDEWLYPAMKFHARFAFSRQRATSLGATGCRWAEDFAWWTEQIFRTVNGPGALQAARSPGGERSGQIRSTGQQRIRLELSNCGSKGANGGEIVFAEVKRRREEGKRAMEPKELPRTRTGIWRTRESRSGGGVSEFGAKNKRRQ